VRDTLHASRAQPPAREMLFGIGPQPGSADHTAARLRAATRYYEQHVIAWHALGHLSEARAARDHIAHYRQKRDAEPDQPANTPIENAAPTSHHDAPRAITTHHRTDLKAPDQLSAR
jgi:hypothetical protein